MTSDCSLASDLVKAQTILQKRSAKVCRTSFQNFGSFPVCGAGSLEGLTVTSHLAMQIQNKIVKIFMTESNTNVVKLIMEERKIIDTFVNRLSTIRLSLPEHLTKKLILIKNLD